MEIYNPMNSIEKLLRRQESESKRRFQEKLVSLNILTVRIEDD